MRRRVEVKWFASCVTLEQVAALYKTLVMQHHPDRGGDLHTMQEINAERDAIIKNPSMLGSGFTSNRWRKTNQQKWSECSTDDFEFKPGVYTVKVTSVRENDEKKYVALIFDIAEGPYKYEFSFKPWYKYCVYLSYKTDWQFTKAKNICAKISMSNRGFDALNALCNDRSNDFIGKIFSVKLSASYIDGDGFINDSEVYAV